MSAHRRIILLDEIRGFCILCMVYYHAFYLFGTQLNWQFCIRLFRFFEPLQLLFASAFICISGICSNFSRSVLRRGLYLCAAALAVSGVTIFLLPRLGFDTFQDWFGILHCLGLCMVLTALLRKPLAYVPTKIGMSVCIALFALSWYLCSVIRVQNPYLFPFGFQTETFFSADYFPLFPHLFTFLLGVLIGRHWQTSPPHDWVYQTHVRFFRVIGQRTLWIYLLHVPILLLCIKLIERI